MPVLEKDEETRCLRLNAGMIMVRLVDRSWDGPGRMLAGRFKGGVVDLLVDKEELEGVGVSGMRGRISGGPGIRSFAILGWSSGRGGQSEPWDTIGGNSVADAGADAGTNVNADADETGYGAKEEIGVCDSSGV